MLIFLLFSKDFPVEFLKILKKLLNKSGKMLKIAEKVDVIIVVSGNGVFADVAPLIRDKGVKFECCSFKDSMSEVLIEAVDQYHFLTEDHLYENTQE